MDGRFVRALGRRHAGGGDDQLPSAEAARRAIPSGLFRHLKVVERFHRADEHTILYRFTVNDSTTFTQPWSGEVPFVKMNELIYEYACHEGNYALSNILSGERARDREAAAATKP